MRTYDAVDSHTEGMPARVIVGGVGEVPGATMMDKRLHFIEHMDDVRRLLMLEPRGHSAMSGAILQPPTRDDADWGVIYIEVSGCLPMCGHGTIGVAVTLAWLGRIGPGRHRFETPVGTVSVDLLDAATVAIDNVPSHRHAAGVRLEVDAVGTVVGDVAWGGNWFFITPSAPCDLVAANVGRLGAAAGAVRAELRRRGITGADGAEIDHVEFVGPPRSAGAHGRNYVLCPGGAFDRSPCGTGTSAKIACLAADGALAPGATWVQESVIGSRFLARYRLDDAGRVVPTITGRAWVCAEATLHRAPGDPFAAGMVLGEAP